MPKLNMGTLNEIGKNRWQIIFSHGTDANGKRVRKVADTIDGTRAEAERRRMQLAMERQTGKLAKTTDTLADWLDQWVRNYQDGKAPRTLDHYRGNIRNHLGRLGDVRLDKLDTQTIDDHYRQLREKGLAPNSIASFHRMLNTALNRAVKVGMIPSNPAKDTYDGTRKAKAKPAQPPSTAHLLDVLDLLKEEKPKYYRLVLLAAKLGLRKGEALGLQWSRVDLLNGRLKIDQQLQHTLSTGMTLRELKTESSERTLRLPADVLEVLTEIRREQWAAIDAGTFKDQEYVLTGAAGNPIDPTSVTLVMQDYTQRTGRRFTFHGLRHYFASYMLQRLNIVEVSTMLGHKKVSTTLDVYGHLMPERDSVIQEALDGMLAGNGSKMVVTEPEWSLN